MSFPTVVDRDVEHPNRIQLVPVAGTTDTFDVVPVPGSIVNAGTSINKTLFDNIFSQIPLGSWSTWTPTWTNLTVGSGGTVIAKYIKFGRLVIGYARVTFGAGSAITGAVKFVAPTTMSSSEYAFTPSGTCIMYDSGSTIYSGIVTATGISDNMSLWASHVTGTHIDIEAVSTSIPMTWTTNDVLLINFIYESNA